MWQDCIYYTCMKDHVIQQQMQSDCTCFIKFDTHVGVCIEGVLPSYRNCVARCNSAAMLNRLLIRPTHWFTDDAEDVGLEL